MSTQSMTPVPRNYTRWTATADGALTADLLGVRDPITAVPADGVVRHGDQTYSPDLARMVGVRLIEGAALADAHRAVRASS
jgi:hypothetical protein